MSILSDAPAKVLKEWAIAESFLNEHTNETWPCFHAFLPDVEKLPNDAACIYDTLGNKDGRIMGGEVIVHPGIQVRIRANDYDIGRAKLKTIGNALDVVKKYKITIGSNDYTIMNFSREGDILSLGMDTNERWNFTLNLIATILES